MSDIRDAATDLRDIVTDMGTDAFHALPHAERLAYRAVKKIGRGSQGTPGGGPEAAPDVDWKGFAGLRDLVAHRYFGIDTSQLLPIIRDELPGLLAAVESEIQRRHPPSRAPSS